MNREDQFEQRLERVPRRPVPSAWREEILRAARQATPACLPSRLGQSSPLAAINSLLAKLLWPHPRAWAGLAAAWLLMLVLNYATREPGTQNLAQHAAAPSPELRQMLQQQEQLLVELVGPIEKPPPQPPQPAISQPRSQRREEFLNT